MGEQQSQQRTVTSTSASSEMPGGTAASALSMSSASAYSSTTSLMSNNVADCLEQLDGQLEKTWKRVRWLNKIVKCIRQKHPSTAPVAAAAASTSHFMVPLRPTKLVKRRPSLPPMSRLMLMQMEMERKNSTSSDASKNREDAFDEALEASAADFGDGTDIESAIL